MQGSRLFQIIYYLLDQGGVTAPKLAEKFEVSVRTIYRDIDALKLNTLISEMTEQELTTGFDFPALRCYIYFTL